MILEPISVIAADRKQVLVNPGDTWPLPYKGSRYAVVRANGADTIAWHRYDQRIYCVSRPQPLIQAIRNTKGNNGSFRISAHGAVIAKTCRSDNRWTAKYVGKYDGNLTFDGIDNNPSDLKRGMYWTGFPFHHGETWTVSSYPRFRNQLRWKNLDRWFGSTERFPELIDACLSIRPRGGRIYVTETGHVWMNLPDGGVSPVYRDEFRELQRNQLNKVCDEKNGLFLRLIFERIKATRTRPIFIGRICQFDHGEAPWTGFGTQTPTKFYADWEDNS